MAEQRKGEGFISIEEAAKQIGIKKKVLEHYAETGFLNVLGDAITDTDCRRIQEQKKTFISLSEMLLQYSSRRFQPRLVRHRDKYVDYLEQNRYFGVEIHEAGEILFAIPKSGDFYIRKEDALFLGFKSERFFQEYGLTEEEKIRKIISQSKPVSSTLKRAADYLETLRDESSFYTPSMTDFVRIARGLPELARLTDEDVITAIEDAGTTHTKGLLSGFFRYASLHERVGYHDVRLKEKETHGAPAYPYRDYVRLAGILFNEDYDREHGLTAAALENHLYAETWMYLSCHYVCGWRSSDICGRWIYPCLNGSGNPFGIVAGTLREDILNGAISEKTYESVALYTIRKIELAANISGKTGHGKLRTEIVPDLRKFFGKLSLIAECHHMQSGEGYMAAHRTPRYRSWSTCAAFFGEAYVEIFGRSPIQSRRLNKSYLQGLEESARANGNSTLASHVIAAFARNHADIDTTAVYLHDHGLTGESADVVLYMMMQRGVFSVPLYAALMAAFPGAFEKLTAKEQTELMRRIPLSAYELEMAGAPFLASERVRELFTQGQTKEPALILKAMFSLAQGRGRAKDAGIWCMKKALGYACENPAFVSCIANLCPYHIFTREGLLSLVNVIREYRARDLASGDSKYGIALRKYIIPAFQDVLNELLKEMSSGQKEAVRALLKEALDEK